MAPRTVERVNPTTTAEVVLCDVGAECIRRQRFASPEKLEVLFIYDQVKVALLAAGAAIAVDAFEFPNEYPVPNRAAMAASLDELRRGSRRLANGSPDSPPCNTRYS